MITWNGNCSESFTVVLNPNNGPVITANALRNVTCIGAGDGIIEFNADGNGQQILGYIVSGVTSNGYSAPYPTNTGSIELSNLNPGIYEITVITVDGCISKAQVEITEPNPIKINVEEVPETICAADDGKVRMEVISGGTAPYSIEFINPAAGVVAGDSLNNLAPATDYFALVTDFNDCAVYVPFEIEPYTEIEPVITLTDPVACYNPNSGTLQW
ncbi:MAG: hypothetical protein R2784_08070 [Saprospiraceae bacterium]